MRLPTHLEVAALIRRVETAGGFATVLTKGERDAGTLLVVLVERGANARVYERLPQLDGSRKWSLAKAQNPQDPHELAGYLNRRGMQDPDLWIIELDVRDGERFVDELAY
ncbi:DUF1491 family protein [Novosphingobium sp. RD2P27]|uniref:DUF1491 family protein n=1 Tax=Novosphingobium kalidii TaxID=3230299 RepID=A0ABV2D4V0_9SPHN